METKERESKMIQELITHINRLESKISAFEEKISDSADIPVVNKLDIINLKNEIEKIKMVFPSISKDQIDKFQYISKLLESDKLNNLGDVGDRIETAEKNLDVLNERLNSLETTPIPEGLMEEIQKMKSPSSKGKSTKSLEAAVSDLSLEFKKIKKKIADLKPVKIPEGIDDIAGLTEEVNKISYLPKDIRRLEKQVESLTLKFLESQKDVEKASVQKHLKKMSADISALKSEKRPGIDAEKMKKEITRDILRELKKMVS